MTDENNPWPPKPSPEQYERIMADGWNADGAVKILPDIFEILGQLHDKIQGLREFGLSVKNVLDDLDEIKRSLQDIDCQCESAIEERDALL